MEGMEEKQKKIPNGTAVKYAVTAAVILVVILGIVLAGSAASGKQEPDIISRSTLEKIIHVSDLSTFQAVYNGIAEVRNEKKPEKVDYYVSYEAKVKAGIDFEKVAIMVAHEEKLITVTLPEIEIKDVNVDITTLDYIFENEKANTSTVVEEAYKKCIEDVTNESGNTEAIYDLAEQNARNIVEALIRPFMEQLDEAYQLQID